MQIKKKHWQFGLATLCNWFAFVEDDPEAAHFFFKPGACKSKRKSGKI